MSHATPTAATLEALVQCLEEEYLALLAEDAGQLETVLLRKEQLLERLAVAAGSAAGAHETSPGARADADPPWRRRLAQARALNARNARALAPRAASKRARLNFLQAALRPATVYGASGAVASISYAVGGRRGSA